MRKLESALMVAAALVLGLGLATQANALAFTLADTITLSDPNSDLELTFLPDYTVSGTTNCVIGTCTLGNDLVVFSVQVTQGTPSTDPDVDEIGASVVAANFIEGWGAFTDPAGVAPSGGTGPPLFQALWDFDNPPGANLTNGDISKPLFVTYTGSFVGGETINFMVHPVGGVLFSSGSDGNPNTTLVIVPEPSTLALTAAMLAALAGLGRRRN